MSIIGSTQAVDVNSLFAGATGDSQLTVNSDFSTTGGAVTVAPKSEPNSFWGNVLNIVKVGAEVYKEVKPLVTTVKPNVVTLQPAGNNVAPIISPVTAQGIIPNGSNTTIISNPTQPQGSQSSNNFFGNIDWLSIGVIGTFAVVLIMLARGKR